MVTGAARGIGEAIAIAFASEGADMYLSDVDLAGVEAVLSKLPGGANRGQASRLDVSDADAVAAYFDDLAQRTERIDVLVNNAGIIKVRDFFSLKEEEWDRIFDVNAKGTFLCMQAAGRQMRQAGSGKIINLASIGGKAWHRSSNIAYASSKGAVITMTRVAALALAPYDVNVNSICPGLATTPMYVENMRERAEKLGITEQEQIENQVASIPLRRTQAPEEIADLALFLASEQAKNITGQSVNVDGGLVWD